jgi:hypothetical protein
MSGVRVGRGVSERGRRLCDGGSGIRDAHRHRFGAPPGGWDTYTGTAGDVSGLTGVTFGAGLTRKGMGIDYSLVPQGDLGMTHWISLGHDF